MGTDLTGGLDPAHEYFLEGRPTDPGMRDSATLWIMDDSGRIALPRVTFDAIGADWDRPWVQLNLVIADGRTLRLWSQELGHAARDTAGNCAIRGAGPLRFQCVEPFRRWTMEFEGTARQSTAPVQMAGKEEGDLVRLSYRLEAEMAAPPWLMGGMTAEAARKMTDGDAGALMGGLRYEQLCRVSGQVRVADEAFPISGTGMRVRRQGVRHMGAATGHCQHSALFPSGRGFGAIAFAPGPDGTQSFNEGFVLLEGGRKLAARVVEAPWMKRLVAKGDDASLLLETESGPVRIAGEVLLSMFDHNLFEMADSSILHQGVARYVWDGEETIGLIERCTLRAQLEGIEG